jgi:L-ascorbate metabolism protein UlaG (beta-lactamase superfamily)
MKISAFLDDVDDEVEVPGVALGEQTPVGLARPDDVHTMNTESKARLQRIKDRVASHTTPYTTNRGQRRRGMDGLAAVGGVPGSETEDHALLPQVLQEVTPGTSFASKLLSVATTPLRAAWGMVKSQMRTPSASPLGLEDDGEPAVGANVSVPQSDLVLPQAGGNQAGTPDAMHDIADTRDEETRDVGEDVDGNNGDTQELRGPGKVRTPFDGVLGRLKEGPMAGGTPARHPAPTKTPLSARGLPQSMQAPRSAQPAFTFNSTKQRLLSSVPVKQAPRSSLGHVSHQERTPVQAKRAMVFGSTRGAVARDAPLAWTPLRATPLAPRSTGVVRTRFAAGSRFAPRQGVAANKVGGDDDTMPSRKRRADDINGMTPSLDDGSVSLLDMQRRRRFKPTEDPGTVQRRSWRAGRTPYSHMARYRRRIDEEEDKTQYISRQAAGPSTTPRSTSSIRPTTDTARRILDTLDSMEEKIRKSKEPLSPLEAKVYTSEAKAPPPPGASLGGSMLPTSNQPVVDATTTVSTPTKTIATATAATNTGTITAAVATTSNATDNGDKTPLWKAAGPPEPKPFLVVQEPASVNLSEAGSWKDSESAKKMLGSSPPSSRDGGKKKRTRVVAESVKPPLKKIEASPPKAELTTVSSYRDAGKFQFGTKANPIKESVEKAIQGVTPSIDRTKFVFGKDKLSTDDSDKNKPTKASGRWNDEFLKKNEAAAALVTAAVESEVKKGNGAEGTTDAAPAFTFGTSSSQGQAKSGVSPAFSFGMAVEKQRDGEERAPPFVFAASGKEKNTPVVEGALAGMGSAAEKKDEPTAAALTPGGDKPSTGWGSDFLKNNAAAASEATAAAEKEMSKKDVLPPSFAPAAPLAPPTSSGFKFGAPAADVDASKPSPSSPSPAPPAASGGFKFGDTLAFPSTNHVTGTSESQRKVNVTPHQPATVPAFGSVAEKTSEEKPKESGWASDFLKKNADVASAAASAIEKEVNKESGVAAPPAVAPTFTFGAPVTKPANEIAASGPAFQFGAKDPGNAATTSGFTFGSSSVQGSVLGSAAEKKDEPTAAALTPGGDKPSTGWGSDFLKNNAAAASEATAAAEKEMSKKDVLPPSFAPAAPLAPPTSSGFKFGAPAADVDASKPSPSSPSPAPPAASGGFKFGTGPGTESTNRESGGFGTSSVSAGGFGSQGAHPPKFTFGAAAAVSNPSATSSQDAPGFKFGGTVPAGTNAGFGGPQAAPPPANPFGASTPAANPASGQNLDAFGMSSSAPGGFGSAGAGGFNAPSGFGSSGGFGTQSSSGFGGFGATAPFGNSSSTAAFGAPAQSSAFGTGNSNAFGQPSSGQFGAVQSSGFQQQNAFGAPNPFAPPSGPSQMIPNNPDNPFGGTLPAAGGFNVGSSGTAGNTQSEGRRKVKVKRNRR